MKVNQQFVFDDTALRQIAQEGMGRRSGKATRQECRLWLNKLVDSTLQHMNEPKVRRRKPIAVEDPNAVPSGAVCANCRDIWMNHGKQGRACPVSRTYNRPTKFKAVTV